MKNSDNRKIIISLITNAAIAILLFFTIFFARLGIDHYVADSFSVTGILMLLFAALKFAASEGVFFIVGWSFKKIVDAFRKVPKYKNMKYHDYIEMKQEEERMILWPTLVVGAIFFIIGLIISLMVM